MHVHVGTFEVAAVRGREQVDVARRKFDADEVLLLVVRRAGHLGDDLDRLALDGTHDDEIDVAAGLAIGDDRAELIFGGRREHDVLRPDAGNQACRAAGREREPRPVGHQA